MEKLFLASSLACPAFSFPPWKILHTVVMAMAVRPRNSIASVSMLQLGIKSGKVN